VHVCETVFTTNRESQRGGAVICFEKKTACM
jgi:hypothetical protein